MIIKICKQWLVLILGVLICVPAFAQLTIEIVGGGGNLHTIALPAFKSEVPGSLTAIIKKDLTLSGAFKIVDDTKVDNHPYQTHDINTALWRAQGAQSIAIGTINSVDNNNVNIQFRLMDLVLQKELVSGQFTVKSDQLRPVAHTIADMIYQAITGKKGFFNTRIAYVSKVGQRYSLQISDVDGYATQTIVSSTEPIISPAWSTNGQKIAYVSFESRKPVVWVQDLASGNRYKLANFKGSNSAPAWSPDSQTLAVVLTLSGSSQIYTIPAGGGSPRRLTSGQSIDTEPVWSPDGQAIYFVSDRAGGPQIYRMSAGGGQAQRMTWDGNYNVSPKISPDGRYLTYVSRQNGNFLIMLKDLNTQDTRVLANSGYNERPSFAPNNSMVLYAQQSSISSVLFATNLEGGNTVKLSTFNGSVQDPIWGPSNHP